MENSLQVVKNTSVEQKIMYGCEKIKHKDGDELSYLICPNIFASTTRNKIVDNTFDKFDRIFLVIDTNITSEKISNVLTYFSEKITHNTVYYIQGGEGVKNFDEVLHVLNWLDHGGFVRRSDIVVLVGGGSVLDIGSFASSIYRRGVDHVRVPTTLLGLVDAGIGVKSAINFNGNKNRIGSYQKPILSIIDPSLIDIEDVNKTKNGICEIIKAAIIGSCELFYSLYENRFKLLKPDFFISPAGISILKQAIDVLLREIAANPNEHILKRTMDFGHILSPCLEKISTYKIPHGLAVIKEVVFCCRYSVELGNLKIEEMHLIENLLNTLNIDYDEPLFNDQEFLQEAIEQAIKHRQGMLSLPLPSKIGFSYFVDTIDCLKGISC